MESANTEKLRTPWICHVYPRSSAHSGNNRLDNSDHIPEGSSCSIQAKTTELHLYTDNETRKSLRVFLNTYIAVTGASVWLSTPDLGLDSQLQNYDRKRERYLCEGMIEYIVQVVISVSKAHSSSNDEFCVWLRWTVVFLGPGKPA